MMSTASPSTFNELSRRAAEVFLQTVVVVDDQAHLPPLDMQVAGQREEAKREEIERGGGDEAVSTPLPRIDTTIVEPDGVPASEEPGSHSLDAQVLVGAFASAGLVCAVLRPEKKTLDQTLDNTAHAARRADIVVVDWQMFNDDGRKALDVMTAIVKADGGSPRRMRLIVIYSALNDLVKIRQSTIAHLKKDAEIDLVQYHDNALGSGPVRILILAKPSAPEPAPGVFMERVKVENLPDRIIDEFTKMTAGIGRNLVLHGLATLRSNTHALLTKIDDTLDAPFLTHRALLPDPDDAQDHLVGYLSEELSLMLEECEVAESANMEVLHAWLLEKHPSRLLNLVDNTGTAHQITLEKAVELLEKGIANWKVPGLSQDVNKKFREGEAYKHLTEMFDERASDALFSDGEFAILTSLESRYSTADRSPVMRMGTIVASEKTNEATKIKTMEYWLCVQPLCDGVRIKRPRPFPLLPFESAGNLTKFDTVITQPGGGHTRLRLKAKLYETTMHTFSPDNGRIRARKEGDHYYFTSDAPSVKFMWIANLKIRHAQRVMNTYGTSVMRVGLNESEWLRRSFGNLE